jgi:hypothetical protein
LVAPDLKGQEHTGSPRDSRPLSSRPEHRNHRPGRLADVPHLVGDTEHFSPGLLGSGARSFVA